MIRADVGEMRTTNFYLHELVVLLRTINFYLHELVVLLITINLYLHELVVPLSETVRAGGSGEDQYRVLEKQYNL